jgi:hypothetical protein
MISFRLYRVITCFMANRKERRRPLNNVLVATRSLVYNNNGQDKYHIWKLSLFSWMSTIQFWFNDRRLPLTSAWFPTVIHCAVLADWSIWIFTGAAVTGRYQCATITMRYTYTFNIESYRRGSLRERSYALGSGFVSHIATFASNEHWHKKCLSKATQYLVGSFAIWQR